MPTEIKPQEYVSNHFIICCSGQTVDGRDISVQNIRDMAEQYSVDLYAARIWLEHLRSAVPDSIFAAHGDVLEVGTTENKQGELCLTASIKPLPSLVEMNKRSQKVYTSVEIIPNFRQTGKAYLVGLAVTDSPASVCTERLKFNLTNPGFFSEQDEPGERMFTPFIDQGPLQFNDQSLSQSPDEPALSTDLTDAGDPADITTFNQQLGTLTTLCGQLTVGQKRLAEKMDQLSGQSAGINELRKELALQRDPSHIAAPFTTGGSANHLAEC